MVFRKIRGAFPKKRRELIELFANSREARRHLAPLMLRRQNSTPLKLALTYAAITIVWVFGTDILLRSETEGSPASGRAHLIRDLIFAVITTAVLFIVARRYHQRMSRAAEALATAHRRSERASRMYATLSAVNRRILRPADRATLVQAICDALIQPGQFTWAWIGQHVAPTQTLTPLAQAGGTLPPPLSLDEANDTTDPTARIAEALRSGEPVICQQVPAAGDSALGTLIRRQGLRSCAAVPFTSEGGEKMVLSVYRQEPDFFDDGLVAMLRELVADLEHGLDVITQRERHAAAEAALRASEERYRFVTESGQDVIWTASLDAQLDYVSPTSFRLLGRTPAEIIAAPWEEFLTPASCQRLRHELRHVRAELEQTGRMSEHLIELEQIHRDGSIVPVEATASGLYDRDGRCIGIIGVTRNISRRRSAEKALAAEVARCRALLDVSTDGIHVTDLEGRLIDANEVFLRERGFTREEIPGLRIENWNADLSPAEIQVRHAAIGPEPTLFETRHRRRDGTVFAVEIRAKRVEVDGRAIVYCTTRDITERHALEQRLLRSQRLESVGLIASGIAHDLNNVLTPILLSTGLLEMRYRTLEDRTLLEPIEAAARRGSNIVQQILTFARGAEGQRVAIEPKLLLKELTSLIRETFPRNISHRLEIAPDASALTGDPTQLHQVFLNLAVNARDAMPEGGTLTLEVHNQRVGPDTVRLMPAAKPGDYVCITVSDTGTGMTSDVLDHIFEPFFSTKPRGRGTGLGLSTVHGLVRSHGGFVEVNSVLGRGSEFRVFLPAAKPTDPTAAAPAAAPAARLGRGEAVLVADDEPAILLVAQSVLRRQGFNVLTAADGREALTLLDRHRTEIAVVVTDVMMPNFDGVRLATEVRRRSPTLPIVAMSGLIAPAGEGDNHQRLRDLGVTTTLDKPYSERQLIDAIAAALARPQPNV